MWTMPFKKAHGPYYKSNLKMVEDGKIAGSKARSTFYPALGKTVPQSSQT